MKRTFTSKRTKQDENEEYIGLAIVAIGLVAMIITFLVKAHII